MSTKTSIEWTDETWNPVRGCSLVSAGCANCYAMKQAHRFSGPGQPYDGLTELGPQGPRWTGKIRLVPEVLEEPLHWKRPRRVFVNSMSDLFHEDVPDYFIIQVFFTMAVTPRHTYQILTKRPERMRAILSSEKMLMSLSSALAQFTAKVEWASLSMRHNGDGIANGTILPNVWLGVSCEDQQTAYERIPLLLQTPAAIRFVSAEPLLCPISFRWAMWDDWKYPNGGPRNRVNEYDGLRMLDWVIVGGESGPKARPCNIAWIRSIKDQCQAAGVPCFVKQIGSVVRIDGPSDHVHFAGKCDPKKQFFPSRKDKKGGDPEEWPTDLRVREFPC